MYGNAAFPDQPLWFQDARDFINLEKGLKSVGFDELERKVTQADVDAGRTIKQLQVKTISCKDVTFRVFGLSLTTLNIILSLILIIFLTKIFINDEKFKN